MGPCEIPRSVGVIGRTLATPALGVWAETEEPAIKPEQRVSEVEENQERVIEQKPKEVNIGFDIGKDTPHWVQTK